VCPRRLLPIRHRHPPWSCPPGAVRGALGSISLLLAACSAAASPSSSPDDGRVIDPVTPEFRAPTRITNPLFPVGGLDQLVLLEEGGNRSVRVELTLLPQTRVVEWDGGHIQTKVVQRLAYDSGEVLEVALEFYAQADDGSVWRFGAEVDQYAAGVITANDRSWLAGRDGPPGMVMPAQPAVGDVFHPANVPGVALDEATVLSTTEHVETAHGPVDDAVLIEVHHLDGTVERDTFVPGYGELRTDAGGETLVVALALPVDARPGPVPRPVIDLGAEALALYDWTPDGKSTAIEVPITDLATALAAVEADAPRRLFDAAEHAVKALRAAARTGVGSPDVRRASCIAALAATDLAAPYRERESSDLERMRFWARMAGVDAQVDARDRVRSDVAILESIWARIARIQDPMAHLHISDALVALRDAVDRDDLAAVSGSAMILVRALDGAAQSTAP
jgi:hypothetical protein